VDLGPRDIHSEQLTERAQVLVDRYTARLKEDPDDVEAYHYRGHALDRLLRHEEAVADLTRAIRLRPNDAHLLDVRARNRAILQQFDLAIEDLDAALALDPNVADFRAHLAWCCNNRAWQLAMKPASARDVARALPLARRADELAPGVGPYLRTLGFAEYRAGRYAEAVATLERGLAINRGEFAGYDLFLLAMAYRKGGHGAEARSCHDRAVRWVAEQKGLSELDTLQLADLRTEAESVLAVPADELPADVFAPSS
jgi:tetratricopeptide (TPR) repeat protein